MALALQHEIRTKSLVRERAITKLRAGMSEADTIDKIGNVPPNKVRIGNLLSALDAIPDLTPVVALYRTSKVNDEIDKAIETLNATVGAAVAMLPTRDSVIDYISGRFRDTVFGPTSELQTRFAQLRCRFPLASQGQQEIRQVHIVE